MLLAGAVVHSAGRVYLDVCVRIVGGGVHSPGSVLLPMGLSPIHLALAMYIYVCVCGDCWGEQPWVCSASCWVHSAGRVYLDMCVGIV
jgi:hypothetical protein